MAGPQLSCVYTVEAFDGAIAEKAGVLLGVGAFCRVILGSVAGLAADVAADVFFRPSTFIRRMGEDMASCALFKGGKARSEINC